MVAMVDAAKPTTRERVTALVAGLLDQAGRFREVGLDERLVDAGLTSMDMVNLMLAVEAEFDVLIPPDDITPGNFRSIATVEALVERVAAAAA